MRSFYDIFHVIRMRYVIFSLHERNTTQTTAMI